MSRSAGKGGEGHRKANRSARADKKPAAPAKAEPKRSQRAAPPSASPDLKSRARRILTRLRRAYPEARCALDYRSPLDLYVATVLSAQCTDERVNQVTPALFARCRRPEDYLALGQEGLEEMIRPTGFFRAKSRSILGACQMLLEEFDGEIPGTLEELVRLPGAGRKTANVILGEAFATPGITVDTHVGRVSRRLELTSEEDPVKVEFALMPLFPRKEWTNLSHLLITHGRTVCKARKPECGVCPIAGDCPYPARTAAGSAPARSVRSAKPTRRAGT